MAPSIRDRLTAKIIVTVFDCHEWQGYRNDKGYGRIHYKKKRKYVHRLAMELELGRDLYPDEVVLHRCDNPRCCNPAHLVVGSILENVQDMDSKGRRATNRSTRRLTSQEVLQVRLYLKMGIGCQTIAGKLTCGETTIRYIKQGRTWRHVQLGDQPTFDFDPFAD